MPPQSIDESERASQRLIAVAALVALAATAAVSPAASLWVRAVPTALVLSLGAYAFAHPGPGGIVAVLAAAIAVLSSTGVLWQIALPAALAVLALLRRWEPRLASRRLQLGDVPLWGTLLCAAVTPVALTGWMFLSAPDLHDITDAIPQVSPLLLLLGAVVFALLNASFEEWIWRGVIQSELSLLFAASTAIALQAVSFGAAHAHGFPRGWAGVALAGLWGGMLGVLRLRSKGLLAPVLAHVVADATIAALVLLWATEP